jgi:heme-degrading monooxygenase HmoA
MFVVIVQFPPVREGKDGAFREWFTWSNGEFAKTEGFVGRKLLKPEQGGNYVSIVEYESRQAFVAMQGNPVHAEAGKRVSPLLDGGPVPQFFEVVIG